MIDRNLTIGWLYPELMGTYGDRGNIITLRRRCKWRNIDFRTKVLDIGFEPKEMLECDLLFMGGAQDRQQKIVAEDLKDKVGTFSQIIRDEIPGLYICGAYQFLGKYYKEADGTVIPGLGIIDIYTENPNTDRMIGDIAIIPRIDTLSDFIFVGFENHGGRTTLGKNVKPFGNVLSGFGNNGNDKTEGAIYKNSICTYLHGPVLPKNPELADYLIKTALEKKYKKTVNLEHLDDTLEKTARTVIAQRLGVKV
ncbi:MAG: glutamine amidotransferase [Candidatus Levybacteria bacterium CG_4_9_14_3_um_filter_35_16]|nr:MAG: glutamine amidotransferase [Candidatus Levybacteria bacterium CG22_combo_CG10-13_8_21_14_all_35_11]PIY94793.1 MAG: glutamine amidotransferase [Candidatus Levybacteria bacterium CG_4_10_14_0_8_um_filter_35_23]PJA91195.1 MAG: glutamine amidotransferase [Candidatus Levybacteria bacterium CG_4_9_14_3_um_filter_35_16]PJC54873.1 MAG: glutamine amidotransferase [Candidatus Levybacteria bacterium CG_4_9_14_0_2_um_filter_35_21]